MTPSKFLRPALLSAVLLCSGCVVEPVGYDAGPAPVSAGYYGAYPGYYPGYAAYPWDTGVTVDIGNGYGRGWYGGRGGYRGGYRGGGHGGGYRH